ncbi:MAG: hypothetical protein LBS75_00675 [Synergistaceae bacterium]|jgi:hypothetical protein|nr:hypothetical protein [Synergistaceae bacterium]
MTVLLLLQVAIASLSPQKLSDNISSAPSSAGGNTYIRVMETCNDNTLTAGDNRFARSRLDAFFAEVAADTAAIDYSHGSAIDAADGNIPFRAWHTLVGRALQAAPKSNMVSRK